MCLYARLHLSFPSDGYSCFVFLDDELITNCEAKGGKKVGEGGGEVHSARMDY